MKSDIEIAQENTPLKITEIAAKCGIDEKYIEQYGNYKAKIDYNYLKDHADKPDGKLILVKPQTYMNLSGNCVSEVISWYKPEPEETLVVYDDIDLPLGKLRMRKKGSAGTHNGMRSIVSLCGRDDFPRLRVGVGAKPPQWDLADYVLSHYQEGEEQETQFAAFLKAAEVIRVMWTQGLDRAMQLANASDKKDRKEAGEETK